MAYGAISSVAFLALVCSCLTPVSHAVSCLQCFNSTGWKQCFPACHGDFCFIHRDFEGSTQGCVSGVPELTEGCWQESKDSSVCFCSTDSCNTASLQAPPQEIYTLNCDKFDHDRSNITVTCEGTLCYYRKEYDPDFGVSESGSCSPSAIRPVFYDIVSALGESLLPASACYHTQDDIDSSITDCICKTEDRCNRRDIQGRWESSPGVRCQMIPRSPDDYQKTSQSCSGQYCFLQRATVHSGTGFDVVSYRKGCFNVTGSQKFVSVGHRQFDQGTATEEMWFCRQDFCNSDLLTADRSANSANLNLKASTLVSQYSGSPRVQPEMTQSPFQFLTTRRVLTRTRDFLIPNSHFPTTRQPSTWPNNQFPTPTMIPTRNYNGMQIRTATPVYSGAPAQYAYSLLYVILLFTLVALH